MNKNKTNDTLKSYTMDEVMGAVMRLQNEERKSILYSYEPKKLYEHWKSDEDCSNTISSLCQYAQYMRETVESFADLLKELHSPSKDFVISQQDKMKRILELYYELDNHDKVLVSEDMSKQNDFEVFMGKLRYLLENADPFTKNIL